ncbi:hypothetical protein ACIOBL_26935 [Paenibacillus taichungensis]|uniref:hypothetical protein n=1 Tax=Paenibacillus taichungensis TaxID=484184 RepID=UPI003830AD09
MIEIKYFWQITKYTDDEHPLHQQGKKPTWTSVSDIGKIYDGNKFTVNDYLRTEEMFIRAIKIFMINLGSSKIFVRQLEKPLDLEVIKDSIIKKGFSLEDYTEMLKFYQLVENGTSIGLNEVEFISRLALREYIWVELESNSMFVRFDYDYYVDIGSTIDCEKAVKQVREMGLSVNLWKEPYPFSRFT